MTSSVSKTEQLKEILLKDIKGGVYKPGDKLPSILSICKKYSVSKHTVSQTLSNLSELGVLDLANGKATRVSEAPFQNNIEIIYSGLTPIDQQEFWSTFYQGITDEINATPDFSYSYRMINTRSPKVLENLQFKNSIGGLLIGTSCSKVVEYVKRYGLSLLMVYDRTTNQKHSFVSCDYSKIMQQIVDLFVANGRRKLAYIGLLENESGHGINVDKYNFFIAAVKSHGLRINTKWYKNTTHLLMDESYDTMKKLLESEEQPDGIFLSSDVLAPSVYRALYEAGLSVPKDVMMAGCDNLRISKYLIPSLTTIELPRYEMGRTAAKNLILNIQNGEKIIQTNFSPKIVIRESLN